MTKKSQRIATPPAQSDLKRIIGTCAKVVTAIDEHVDEAIDANAVPQSEMDKAIHLAHLGRNLTQMACELRKIEAHEAKLELTDVQLIEHFRKMTPDKRAQWGRDLAAMDRKGSVLG